MQNNAKENLKVYEELGHLKKCTVLAICLENQSQLHWIKCISGVTSVVCSLEQHHASSCGV